jgi:hypothetical protein
MTRIARWLVGYRDDLDLTSKWWHRLAKVVFFLFTVLVGLVSGFFVFDYAYYEESQAGWPANQVNVITDLESFTVQHPAMADTFSAFRLTERIGERRDGRIKRVTPGESDAFCNAKLSEHRADLAKFLGVAGMSPSEASYWAHGELERLRHAPLQVPASAIVRGSTYGPLSLLKPPEMSEEVDPSDVADEFDLFNARYDGHRFPEVQGHCVAMAQLPILETSLHLKSPRGECC